MKQLLYKSSHIVYIILFFLISYSNAQSPQELGNMKEQYDNFQKQRSLSSKDNLSIQNFNDNAESNLESFFVPYKVENKIPEALFFGYDFFTKRDTVRFWENLPAPSNYLLGAGDELIVTIWGETQVRLKQIINREGEIFYDKVGLLNFSGKSISEAKNYLKNKFSMIYSTLNGKNPSSYIDISLGELRSINVNFAGQVKYPGVYPIHPFSTVITGLIQSGGIDTTGSLRNISVLRDGLKMYEVDLYSFFTKGQLPSNIQLRDQDVVLVNPRKNQIKIQHGVKNPGIFEGKSSETILDLINYAGGLRYDSSEIIELLLKKENQDSTGLSFFAKYINFDNSKNFTADNCVEIKVLPLFDENQEVEIIGQVKFPGIYKFYEKMTLSDLIHLSGGIKDSTFWNSVYQEQAEIIRKNSNSVYQDVIKINLNNIEKNSEDILLKNFDKIVIHPNKNFFDKENVSIDGAVRVPGYYPIIKIDETLQSFINRAGGFTEKAYTNGIEIYRDSLRVAWNNAQFNIQPGDSIYVNQMAGTIQVLGEVYNPGLVEFVENKNINYYVNLAGGLTKFGDKRDIIVQYPNGQVVPRKSFRPLAVKDGSIIIVNQKESLEPFSYSEFANNIISVLSSLITILVLSKQL